MTGQPIDDDVLDEMWRQVCADPLVSKSRDPRSLFLHTLNIGSAFKLQSRCITCVDEGITEGIHLPGSGVLLSQDERDAAIRKAGIEEFTTHDNCGAFALAYPNESDRNRACREWGEQEASRLCLPFRHISAGEMDRPPLLHTATVAYYDGSGVFNRIDGLPRGFVVSRQHFSATAQEDLALCLKIAFGQSGFGEKFSSENPFTVVVLAHPTEFNSARILRQEVSEIIAFYGSSIKLGVVHSGWHMRDEQ